LAGILNVWTLCHEAVKARMAAAALEGFAEGDVLPVFGKILQSAVENANVQSPCVLVTRENLRPAVKPWTFDNVEWTYPVAVVLFSKGESANTDDRLPLYDQWFAQAVAAFRYQRLEIPRCDVWRVEVEPGVPYDTAIINPKFGSVMMAATLNCKSIEPRAGVPA
jgi:hypothetical protein